LSKTLNGSYWRSNMTTTDNYDLVIIGSGPGGYVAAVRAAQLGLKTACVEKSARLGGVCLNVGCIPSKALLDSSEYYHLAREHFAEHGIKTGRLTLDLTTLMKRKDTVVKELTDSVQKLLEGNHIDIVHGTAQLVGDKQVEVTLGRKKRILKGESILLATGSQPVEVSGMPFDGERIVSSTEALNFDMVPKNLGIVGGGLYRSGTGVGLDASGLESDRNRNVAQNCHDSGRAGRQDPGSSFKETGYAV